MAPGTVSGRVSAPAQFGLGGKVGAELAHHVRVALARQLLPHAPIVLFDEVGERRGGPRLGRRQQLQAALAEGAHEPRRVQRLGVAADAAEEEERMKISTG